MSETPVQVQVLDHGQWEIQPPVSMYGYIRRYVLVFKVSVFVHRLYSDEVKVNRKLPR